MRDNNLKGRKIKTCFLYTVLMFNSSEARMGRRDDGSVFGKKPGDK